MLKPMMSNLKPRMSILRASAFKKLHRESLKSVIIKRRPDNRSFVTFPPKDTLG